MALITDFRSSKELGPRTHDGLVHSIVLAATGYCEVRIFSIGVEPELRIVRIVIAQSRLQEREYNFRELMSSSRCLSPMVFLRIQV